MTTGSSFSLGIAALFINATTTAVILVRMYRTPEVYDEVFETFRATAKQAATRAVTLAFLVAVLFAVVGGPLSTVGIGAQQFTPASVVGGLFVGLAFVLASFASGMVADRFDWETDSAAWTTLWPDSTLEWVVYLPTAWLSTTVDATLYVAFVVGGLTMGTTPAAFGLAGVSAVLAGAKGAWEGPGIVFRTTTAFLVLGVAFVLTRSWLVLAVAILVNSVVHGLQDNAEARYGTAAGAD
ncbi:hypothetical protein [Haloarchaeobius iranensis]|uniref:Uncharacterized protein n=1 Tax=Haloarchaeobius iranensis TaxID=996166 RepID=A0A1G9TBN2_9EURY|nr:hypothetical protein [Haloarchaeobius iranensis]SDM45096.1 hypothetical protein SAMN05192554_102256 [Haloarchaeobius iranensis]